MRGEVSHQAPPDALQHLAGAWRWSRHAAANLFDRALNIGSIRLLVAALCANRPNLRGISRWELFLFGLFFSDGALDVQVDARRGHRLVVFGPELFDDELGVPQAGFDLKAPGRASDHAVRHLPFLRLLALLFLRFLRRFFAS